jgi:hypothetical protein
MAFTTWAALLEQMKDGLANGSWNIREYSIQGRTTKYSTIDEFMKMYRFVEGQVNDEASPRVRRTHAKNGGRALS